MSWSVSAKGNPEEIRTILSAQFDSAKKTVQAVPAEATCVEQVEAIVNGALDFSAQQGVKAVSVCAYGSACTQGAGWPGSIQVGLTFAPVPEKQD